MTNKEIERLAKVPEPPTFVELIIKITDKSMSEMLKQMAMQRHCTTDALVSNVLRDHILDFMTGKAQAYMEVRDSIPPKRSYEP